MQKSLRLNKDLRASILNSIMNKYDESNPEPTSELPTLEELRGLLAENISDKVYGKYQLDNVPKELLNTDTGIKVQTPDGNVEYWNFPLIPTGKYSNNYTYKVSTSESKVEYVFTEDDPLWMEYQEARELTKTFNKEVREHQATRKLYSEEVAQVLGGHNTTGKLLDEWPEVLPYLPKNIANPSSISLPSVSVKKLNEQLK